MTEPKLPRVELEFIKSEVTPQLQDAMIEGSNIRRASRLEVYTLAPKYGISKQVLDAILPPGVDPKKILAKIMSDAEAFGVDIPQDELPLN